MKPDDSSMDNTLGLAVGILTGIPINTTPGAIVGSLLHDSTERATPSSSYDSGSSSYDSGSSSSGGGFDSGGSY